jgi:hypothetical protein
VESRGRSAGRRARPDMARSRARGISRRQRLLMLRGRWLACAFRRFASLWGGDEPCSVVVEENSDAIASRERFRTSSLPGLTRQSIESVGLLRFGVLFHPLHVSMDHRVKPGGDDEEGGRVASLRAKRSNPGGLRGDLDCVVAIAARNDE